MVIFLRQVTVEDWNYVLELRNDSEYRSNFYQQYEISQEEHIDYMNKQEKNPTFFNWIVMDENERVGYVRILDEDISIIIDKKHQNHGIGSIVLSLVEEEAKILGIKKLVGRIMTHNIASQKAFQKNNFKLKMYWYEKEI
jgi:RimJ/RimL family protein N-acetyltransferase